MIYFHVKYYKVVVDRDRCVGCNFCLEVNLCQNPDACIGCLSCYWACPYEARRIVEVEEDRKTIEITVDGVKHRVPERISIKRALELIGYSFNVFPGRRGLSAPCGTGGCWSCAVLVNGELVRSCINAVREGMVIETNVEDREPLRIIHGPQPHTVGGKATPWFEKGGGRYIEVAIWTAGCNLRCPQCQNFHTTYDNVTHPVTPRRAAEVLTLHRRLYNVNGLAISGGEPTLNRRWLIEYFKHLRKLNPDKKARLHLDSNGTLLTEDYIDDLVEAGCNNIGVEPKGIRVETFMKITGINDRELARKYLETSWRAAEYIATNYSDKVYLGIGIPYNRSFMSFEELAEMGEKIASIDPKVQVCVLDYFPTFRNRRIKRPSVREMLKVKKILSEAGLKTVIVQTKIGHIGP